MNLEHINSMTMQEREEQFYKCLSCKRIVNELVQGAPFESKDQLFEKLENLWSDASEEEKLEAFLGHPKIGDIKSLRAKYSNTKSWSSNEQSGAMEAAEETLQELADWNDKYEQKFGFIFIVCATGKSALEMLDLLKDRYPNDRNQEIDIAANEQLKITKLRLEKIS